MGKIIIHCSGCAGCSNSFTVEVIEPTGWTNGSMDADFGYDSAPHWHWLCPECSDQREFFESQCPGCVESFPGCELGRSYLYTTKSIAQNHLRIIEAGKCPFRANGTMTFDRTNGIRKIDLSEVIDGSGESVAGAIRKVIGQDSDR